jgi:nucleotide-binding universal stress UspA family protein
MNALIDDTQRRRTDPRPGDGARELNVLVVALDAVVPTHLTSAKVLVVAPALNSWVRRWLSDEDGARRRAEERAAAVADRLAQGGIHAEGRAGDGDPLLAIADALSTFPADEIVIAARPGRSSGIAEELGSRARVRFALPTFPAAESLPRAA